MKIDFTGRGFDVSDHTRNFTTEKMAHLDRIMEGITNVQVVLSVEKYRHRAEIKFSAQKQVFHGTEESEDMFQSIDKVIDKLEAQVRKHKSKISARKRNTAETIRSGDLDGPTDDESKPVSVDGPMEVIPSDIRVRLMSVEEAAEELQKFKQEFLTFRNAENEAVNVVYRRKDGHIGLINP